MSRPPVEIRPFSNDQPERLDACKSFRLAVIALRVKASEGGYNEFDHGHYLSILTEAPKILEVTDQFLSVRAGLGAAFFRTAVRDLRRPKLKNMLSALTAVIEVAAEREGLHKRVNLDRVFYPGATELQDRSLESVAKMAWGLALIARDQITKLKLERLNDPMSLANSERQREVLEIFAEGFEKIYAALAALEMSEPQSFAESVRSAAVKVGTKLDLWFEKNGESFVGSTAQIGLFAAGVGLAQLGGAQMTIATAAIATM